MATFPGWSDPSPSNLINGFNNRADVLLSHGGNHKLRGLSGDDKIFGGTGRDTLIGGTGNDFLKGDTNGKGGFADLFVFVKNSGKDIVTDFDIGKDVIQILKGINDIKTPADVIEHAQQKGADVVIDLGDGNKIRLKNIDLEELKKSPADHFEVTKNLTF